MIKVSINTKIRQCNHCQVRNIKNTFEIQLENEPMLYIGRICISRITGVDTSGNPYRAAKNIQAYINKLDKTQLSELYAQLTLDNN